MVAAESNGKAAGSVADAPHDGLAVATPMQATPGTLGFHVRTRHGRFGQGRALCRFFFGPVFVTMFL